MKAFIQLPIFIGLFTINGCSPVNRALDDVDNAINELHQANRTFEDLKRILEDAKGKLDDGEYKNQIDDSIGRTSQVAQLGIQGSVDFTRARLIEDLGNVRNAILGKPPAPRIPILSNPQSTKIDYRSTSRQALTIVGWNLDIAQKAPEKYKIVVTNPTSGERQVDFNHVAYHGQYAVTINISPSGIQLTPQDKKMIFKGFDPLFELLVTNSDPTPPEKIVSISGNIKTTNQDREGGICILELRDGSRKIWEHRFPEKPVWKDRYSQPFAWDNLNIAVPANPRLLVILTQKDAQERNILWRFDVNTEMRTNQGRSFRFNQTGLELNCGDGRPDTVSTPINITR